MSVMIKQLASRGDPGRFCLPYFFVFINKRCVVTPIPMNIRRTVSQSFCVSRIDNVIKIQSIAIADAFLDALIPCFVLQPSR